MHGTDGRHLHMTKTNRNIHLGSSSQRLKHNQVYAKEFNICHVTCKQVEYGKILIKAKKTTAD